jgi:predicted dithiol-disulfide oxidoreductase (DUF899 family)
MTKKPTRKSAKFAKPRKSPARKTAPKQAKAAKKTAVKRSAQAKAQPTKALHSIRFPGETAAYRAARNILLKEEIALRRQIEAVAALRRKLPAGGLVPTDYVFDEAGGAGGVRQVKLSELFARAGASLFVYSFMFGPKMERPCPACTSILDALDGEAPHLSQRINLAVVASSPIERIMEFATQRGWRNLRLLSSANNSFNADYHAQSDTGSQLPAAHVFTKRGGDVRHFSSTEMLYAPADTGQNARHVDVMWPLWNVFDLTPEGRGADWQPKLSYPAHPPG